MRDSTHFTRFAKKAEHSIVDINAEYTKNSAVLDLEAVDGNQLSLLDHAAMSGNLHLIIWLALQGVELNTQHSAKKSPLYRAMEKKHKEAAILLLLLSANPQLETDKKSNKTAFTIPRYTSDLEHQANISIMKTLYEEAGNLLADPDPELSKYPAWADQGPSFIGRIRELSEKIAFTGLDAFISSHKLLSKLIHAINRNAAAKALEKDIVVHTAPAKKTLLLGRDKTTEYRLTPGISICNGRRKLLSTDIEPEKRVRFLKEEIFYHVQLRTQLAFYLFVTYYKTRIQLNLSETKFQEGEGDSSINSVACHSALISHVTEAFRWKEGAVITESTRELRSNSENLSEPHLPETSFFQQILAKTTVELPSAVNQYDGKLEGKTTIGGANEARQKLLSLLREVSLGNKNPIQALSLFLTALISSEDGILNNIRLSDYLKKTCPTSPQAMRPLIHRYVFLASLFPLKKNSDNQLHLNRSHVANLLFMDKTDRDFIAKECCDEEALAARCEPYFSKLQDEIKASR